MLFRSVLSSDILLSLTGYTIVNSFTPGPNNIMLAASGVNFGFKRTVPHILGVNFGFALLVIGVGVGLGTLFSQVPQLQLVLKVLGTAYLLWLAWRTARAGEIHAGGAEPQPLTIAEAMAFQAVNPKAWYMAVSAMSLYVRPEHIAVDVATVTGCLIGFNIAGANTWAGFGSALREVLKDPVRIKVFNIVMALALVAAIIPILAV